MTGKYLTGEDWFAGCRPAARRQAAPFQRVATAVRVIVRVSEVR